jgi:hypothetical protein
VAQSAAMSEDTDWHERWAPAASVSDIPLVGFVG